jgi:hypothetical protein
VHHEWQEDYQYLIEKSSQLLLLVVGFELGAEPNKRQF